MRAFEDQLVFSQSFPGSCFGRVAPCGREDTGVCSAGIVIIRTQTAEKKLSSRTAYVTQCIASKLVSLKDWALCLRKLVKTLTLMPLIKRGGYLS